MEHKTTVYAPEGRHDLTITRQFNLPLELLFRAYTDDQLLGQWMGTKVVALESKKNGNYQFETTDSHGKVLFKAHGVIHDFSPNQKITRTFEMENTPFGVQLEVYNFEKLTDESSKLTMHVIYETVAQRDQVLQLPFTQGITMAHNRLQEIVKTLN